MFYKFVFVIIFTLVFSDSDNEKSIDNRWNSSFSYGFCNEKIPISFIDMTFFYNRNKKSQIYGSVHYLIFGGGLGIGYKYYSKSKDESSMFVSICAHHSVMGDAIEKMSGISFAPGYSKYLNDKEYSNRKFNWKNMNYFTQVVKTKIFFNGGLSFTWAKNFSIDDKYTLELIPFLNLETRF